MCFILNFCCISFVIFEVLRHVFLWQFIGCLKINVIYFGISLGLHYLCSTLVYNGVHFEEVK